MSTIGRFTNVGNFQTTGEIIEGIGDYKKLILSHNPVAYWRLDETSGTTVYDSSGNDINGVITGNVLLDQLGATVDGNSCIEFSGGYITMGNNSIFTLTDFTLECWAKCTNIGGLQELLSKELCYKYRYDNNSLGVLLGNGSSWFSEPVFSTNLQPNTWYHLVLTVSSTDGELIIYVNGEQAGSTVFSQTVGTNYDPFNIASYNDSGGELFDGYIDEAAVYNYVLNSGQINMHYQAGIHNFGFDQNGNTYVSELIEERTDALQLNGGYVQLPSGTLIQWPLTIEAWVNPTTFGSNEGVYIFAADPGPRLAINPSGKPWADVEINSSWQGNENSGCVSSNTVSLNEWVHISTVIIPGQQTLYVNGELEATLTIPNTGSVTYNPSTPFVIGADNYVSSPYHELFYGMIRDVRLWNVARTAEEIKSNMNVELIGNESGLVGYWKFHEGPGPTIIDSTANKNDGIMSGSANKTFPTNTSWSISPTSNLYLSQDIQEVAKNTIQFDGTSTYINVPTSPSVEVTGDITLEAWAYVSGFSNDQGINILAKDGNNAYRWRFNTVGHCAWLLLNDGNGLVDFQTNVQIPENSWHHHAVTVNFSTGLITFLMDGEIIYTTSTTKKSIASTGGALLFGAYAPNTELFEGMLRELRIWNITRTQYEIQETMGLELKGNETGLVGYWKFQESYGDTVLDSTSNNNNGTIIGTVTREFV